MKIQEIPFDERKEMVLNDPYFAEFCPWYSDGRFVPATLTKEWEHMLDMVHVPKVIYHFDFKRKPDGTYFIF